MIYTTPNKPKIDCPAAKGDLCFLRSEHSVTMLHGESRTDVDYLPGIVRNVTRQGRVTGFTDAGGTVHRCQAGRYYAHVQIVRQLALTQPTHKLLLDCPQGASLERLRDYLRPFLRPEVHNAS